MRENEFLDKIKNLISVAMFSQDESVQLEENYATGIEYLHKWLDDYTVIDNYKKAEVYLLKALEVNAENYGVYPALGLLYQSKWYNDFDNMELYEKSETNYEKARMCGAVDCYILCNFAMLYLVRWENGGDEETYFNKAESLLLKCIELNEEFDKPIRVLGDMYKIMWLEDMSKIEYFNKCEGYFERFYELNENDSVCCFNLAYIYSIKWRYSEYSNCEWAEKAEKMYLKSIELDPMGYVAMGNLGIIYENSWLLNKSNKSNAEKAIYWYKKSYETNGLYIQSKINLAKLYPLVWENSDEANIDYLKLAEELYLEFIDPYSDDADILFDFAILNSVLWQIFDDNMEYFNKTQNSYIKAVKIDSNFIGAIMNLEQLYKMKIAKDAENGLSTDYFDEFIELATYAIQSDDFQLKATIQLGRVLNELWKLDNSKTKYIELSESLLSKSLE